MALKPTALCSSVMAPQMNIILNKTHVVVKKKLRRHFQFRHFQTSSNPNSTFRLTCFIQRPLAPNLPTWVNSILPKSSCTIALVRNTYLAKVPGYFWHGSEFYLGRFCILLHQTSKVVHAEGFMCARDAAPR